MDIKIGYLVAYDYELLKHSLPTVYMGADKIVVAIDKDRKTFAGETFTIDPSFFAWLKEIDRDNKITIYEDAFYVQGLPVTDADTRERNMVGKKLGEGGWHFHIDVDEYFINFKELVAKVKALESRFLNKKVTLQIYCSVIFKTTTEGYFMVGGTPEKFALITNHPVYQRHRNSFETERHTLNHLIVHQSWGRCEDELERKLRNWSHSDDFDTTSYFEFWKSVNIANYKYISNFHPLYPEYWRTLKFVKANSISELIKNLPSSIPEQKKAPIHKMRRWLPPVIYDRLLKMK